MSIKVLKRKVCYCTFLYYTGPRSGGYIDPIPPPLVPPVFITVFSFRVTRYTRDYKCLIVVLYRHQWAATCMRYITWWSLPSGRRMSSGLTLYFLWVLEWPTRPILAVNCRPQSSQVKRLVSSDLAAGTDWLVKLFRRLRFSTAVTTDNTNFLKVLHLDLLSARSSQATAYIGVQVVTRNGWVDIAARQTTGESYTTAWLFVII